MVLRPFARTFVVFTRRAVKAASLCVLVSHLFLTVLYAMPPNPVKVPIAGLLDATVGVYARQNWSLFAPNPVSSNQVLLAKCFEVEDLKAEIQALARHQETSGWTDLSSPFWAAFQGNRFTAYDRVVRPQSNVLRTYLSGGFSLRHLQDSCQNKNDKGACEVFEKSLVEIRKASEPLLRKVGSAFCKDSALVTSNTYVALRVRTSAVAPWSKRHHSDAVEFSDVSLGIYPLDHDVASTGLFKAPVTQ